MDAREGQHPAGGRVDAGIRRTDLARGEIGPSYQPHVVIEQQVALGFPVAYKERCQGAGAPGVEECGDVKIGEYVDVVDEETAFRGHEKTAGMENASAGLEQTARLVGDRDLHAEVVLRKIRDYLLGEMMDRIERKEMEELVRIGHTLKGSSNTISAFALGKCGFEMEKSAKEGNLDSYMKAAKHFIILFKEFKKIKV